MTLSKNDLSGSKKIKIKNYRCSVIRPDYNNFVFDSSLYMYVLSDPNGPHIGPMNLAIRDGTEGFAKLQDYLGLNMLTK